MKELDIVVRLREHPVELLRCDCVRCEAADEIERLRVNVDRLLLLLDAHWAERQEARRG